MTKSVIKYFKKYISIDEQKTLNQHTCVGTVLVALAVKLAIAADLNLIHLYNVAIVIVQFQTVASVGSE